MKYEDASWHGGDDTAGLPETAGATHIGLFVAWALLSGLAGEIHTEEIPEELVELRERRVTPARFLLDVCDGKFTDEDLNDEGNAFTAAYFDPGKGTYLDDYARVLVGDLPSPYHVADTWENFDILRPVLDRRLAEWRASAT